MSSIITEDMMRILNNPCFGFATSIDAQQNTWPSRHFAYKVEPDSNKLTFMLYKPFADKLIQDAQGSGHLAVCFTFLGTFEALQFKGSYLSHREPNEADMELLTGFRQAYGALFDRLGWPEEKKTAWAAEPAITVEMNIQEVYNQTPAKGTGNQLS